MGRSKIIVLLLMLGTTRILAQVSYQPGYFITNDGQRVDCEIREMNMSSNPGGFQYRVGGGELQDGTIEAIAEFGITGDATFRRFTVDIDRSSEVTGNLTANRNPIFKRERLFLRLLVSGKGVLYEYADAQLYRYFYSLDNAVPKQLVYKRYMQTDASGGYETGFSTTNQEYKQQIFMNLKCGSITRKEIENLKYERMPLMRFFNKYNECTGTQVALTEPEERKSSVRLSIRPGLYYNSFYLENGVTRLEFEKSIAFRIGIEMETLIKHGKWSFTFEPTFQTYSSQISGTTNAIKYSSLDLIGGLRRYLILNETTGLYINLNFAFSLPTTGSASYYNISESANLYAGFGYKGGKLNVEFNYAFPRGLLGSYPQLSSGYSGPGLIFGYRIR
jgi:hypothetical protein